MASFFSRSFVSFPLSSFPFHSSRSETVHFRRAQGYVFCVYPPRILEPICRCDSEHRPPPQHTRYLQVGSPARVEMEVELRRVKFLDVFICFLSSHLLMSPSPKREPSSEPKHAGPGKTRRRVANFRDHVCTPPSPPQGSAGKPPGPCSQCLKHPRGAECPGGDEERGGLKWGERSLPGQRSRQGPISPLPYFYWIGVTRKPRWRRQLLPHWEKHGCD